MTDIYKDELEDLGEAVEGEDAKTTIYRNVFEDRLSKVQASKASVDEFQGNVTRLWSAESQRILGHVLYTPPISVHTSNKRFTEDWALVELNRGEFDWIVFRGNVIHLGTFRSILRSSSLTIISRNQTYGRPIYEEDVP